YRPKTRAEPSRRSGAGLREAGARGGVTISTAGVLMGFGCKPSAPPAPPPPAVFVTDVLQKDVPISAQWVGTTVGFVNAKVMPRVQGYLLKQTYEDGANGTTYSGELIVPSLEASLLRAGASLLRSEHQEPGKDSRGP